MSKVVYKYPLTGSVTELQLPIGAQIIYVDLLPERDGRNGNKNGHLDAWAVVDPTRDFEARTIQYVGTGNNDLQKKSRGTITKILFPKK